MNRTGFFWSDLNFHIDDILAMSNVCVDGVYSHLACADCSSDYSSTQYNNFVIAKNLVASKTHLSYIHLSASSGILNFNMFAFNTIRPGIILYGFEPFYNSYKKLDLKPVARLKSKINFIKNLPAGEKIGYSCSFVLNKNSRIATVPVGYADGIDRSLSNSGFVVIKNNLVPIVGKICMDSFMVDVSRVDVSVGDDVYIWDNINLSLESIAQKANTINYEFLSRISERVPRIFI